MKYMPAYALVLALAFLIADHFNPGSGWGWAAAGAGVFAVLWGGIVWIRTGSPFSDSAGGR